MTSDSRIRAIALGVILQDDMIFVTEYTDPTTGKPYYRPLCGGIEFGEYAVDALQREFQEEIEATLSNIHLIGVLENIFTLDGNMGHQICIMFRATFAENERNQPDYEVVGIEDHETFNAMWKPLRMFSDKEAPLYPDGLLELIENFA